MNKENECCINAKKAMIILNKMQFTNIAVLCTKCDKIWIFNNHNNGEVGKQ